MDPKLLSFSEAKSISIVDYLSRTGHEPKKSTGKDFWYLSPFRDEKTASFHVNARKNTWYDFGESKGGNLIDLVMQFNKCTPKEALEELSSGNYSTPLLHQPKPIIQNPEPPKIEIESVGPLMSPSLIEYLNGRGIDANRAKLYCKEVEFWMNRRLQSAIGFPTVSGSFELRNHWFKGSTSPKDISFIDNKTSKVSVFEGFIDFLSGLKIEHPQIKPLVNESDFLILNSAGLIQRSLPILRQKDEVILFLDNDAAGNKAKLVLRQNGIRHNDASHLYAGHKDVNDLLRSTLKEQQAQYQPRRRSKRLRL